MKTITLTILMLSAFAFSQAPDMIVRVYAPSWQSLKLISEKSLDIAAAHAGEWYDIVADQKTLDRIKSSGLTYEITIYSIAAEKEKVRGQYHSYAEVTQLLRNMASTYPSICKMDSLPIRTYQGRWLYGVKISDEPNIEDPNEGGFLVDGAHHSREWATIETVLFFADSMLRAYGVVPEITNTINTTEIYCFPVINVDGFVYDYPGQLMWRKNREPFGGTTGTDCNRNYAGCCDNIQGDWGAVDEGQASHGPGDETFCGAYNNSGDETRALTLYMKSHTINAYMSYHSYSELLMWPWGWTATATPDAAIYSTIGNRMADMVNSQGGGTYGRGPIYTAIYPVSGSSIEWCYSWNHWVNGVSNLSYTTEVGTSFYQPVGDLDNIVRQNFKALKYLAHYTDSIVLMCEGIVPAPIVHAGDTVPASFAITWQPKNTADNHPTRWELVELSNPSVVLDSLESGTSCWILNGFTLSTSQSHSATHSLFSGNTSDMNSAMYTAHPYIVQTNDSVTFWCYYNMENNYDVAVVEVSENTTEWSNLDTMRFTGTQTTWTRKAFSLTNWIGKSIYIRFRAMSDGGTNNGGFYVDDIRPVCLFANVTSISSSITDTLYSFPSHAIGEFYFYVRGDNAMWDWGDFSGLKKVVVIAAGMPATPTVTKPLDFGRLPDLNPTLTFTSTDPDGDQIRYRVMWDTDPTFASPESSTTANYASGAVVDFNFPSNLANGSTYWWKVKCTDPSGSGYWTQYTISRSLTVDTSLPAATCSWYQTTAAQFGFNTFSATMVQGDSVILVPSGAVIVDTLFEEHFISASMPAGWTVVNGNGDAYLWTVGTSTDLGSYTPPDFGSYYAYYSDDDAGSGNISNNEELLSPKWYVGGITAGLEIVYGYGFQVYETGEKYRLKFRKKTGSGAWTAWADQRVYTANGAGTETVDLTSQLPCDSIQFDWFFSDSTASSHWGYACAADNVVLRYSYTLSNDYGTLTGSGVDYKELSKTYARTKWGWMVWRKAAGGDSIGLQAQYYTGSTWSLVPNGVLPGNSVGFYTQAATDSIDLSALDTNTYRNLRLLTSFYRKAKAPTNPALLDWEVGNLHRLIAVAEQTSGGSVVFGLSLMPNPFNGRLQIAYSVGPDAQKAELKIFDAAGRLVKLFNHLSANQHGGIQPVNQVVWDGSDDVGRSVPAGVYFVRLEADGQERIEKAILLR